MRLCLEHSLCCVGAPRGVSGGAHPDAAADQDVFATLALQMEQPGYHEPSGSRAADAGYASEGRVAFDVGLLELGFRLLVLGGRDSSEAGVLLSAGLGRF